MSDVWTSGPQVEVVKEALNEFRNKFIPETFKCNIEVSEDAVVMTVEELTIQVGENALTMSPVPVKDDDGNWMMMPVMVARDVLETTKDDLVGSISDLFSLAAILRDDKE